jgi:hypothetical protein
MKKFTLLALSLCLFSSCTVYTEKQSEALSQNVYATNDSVNKGRIDLAYYYSDQTTRLVKIPKKRIEIQSIYEAGDVVKNSKTADKTRVVLVPDQYKDEKVVVVGSNDYQSLLKNKAVAEQLKKDNATVLKDKAVVDAELKRQAEMKDKMVNDLNKLQKEHIKDQFTIFRDNVIIVVLLILIAGLIYLLFKGPFML